MVKLDRQCVWLPCGSWKVKGRGLCANHYEIAKRRGILARFPCRAPATCDVCKCAKPMVGQGLCRKHYLQWWRKAHPETARQAAQKAKDLNRLQGGRPRGARIGRLSPLWTGGRLVKCSRRGCGKIAGWRRPCHLRTNKKGFLCKEHDAANSIPQRVTCRVCGNDAGCRSPSKIRKNTRGFLCDLHKPTSAIEVFCEVCGGSAGIRGPKLVQRNKRGFLCDAHSHMRPWHKKIQVTCLICGGDAGLQHPCAISRRKHGFFCELHNSRSSRTAYIGKLRRIGDAE